MVHIIFTSEIYNSANQTIQDCNNFHLFVLRSPKWTSPFQFNNDDKKIKLNYENNIINCKFVFKQNISNRILSA